MNSRERLTALDLDRERLTALDLADRILNRVTEDPDSDESSLSRQYLRALEKIERLSLILDAVLREADERNSPVSDYTIDDLRLEADDMWPCVSLLQQPQRAQISEENRAFKGVFIVPEKERSKVTLLIMPRNLGAHPKHARGHSKLWSIADYVAEWEDGAWHVCKSPNPGVETTKLTRLLNELYAIEARAADAVITAIDAATETKPDEGSTTP